MNKTNEKITLRLATAKDAQSILDIYAEYIESPCTFETVLPSIEQFTQRVTDTLSFYPYILAISECGKVVGYAYAGKQRVREAYIWNAELSVYIAKSHSGQGIGKKLYTALCELLKLQNIKNVYGAIAVPNPASVKLHEQCGFTEIATFHKTGYKCGMWIDVLWMLKRLDTIHDDFPPEAVIPLSNVDSRKIEEILK